jgi:hypothetical protein
VSEVVALPPPPLSYYRDNSMWLDEQIWGHRLWDSQSPWLIFLEFLTVAEACHDDGRLLDDQGRPFPLSFRPNKRLYLRNILYNNEVIFEIAQRYADDATAWRHWLEWMQDNAQAVPERDFSYLKRRFRSFAQFASLVAMIRSSTIESGSNKRWSSRFVFPFGRHAIYEDLNVSNGSASREYIYFGLPGELLYQMLLRSRHGPALRPYLARALDRADPCDRVLELLQPERADDRQDRGNSYLPYGSHPAFDALGQDWLSILQLDLPRFDAYPHLATLGALHLGLYQLVVAAAVCGENRPSFVCEVVAPRKTLVRELSVMNYLKNNQLPQRAIESYIRDLGEAPEWRKAAADPAGFAACRQLLRDKVRWPRDDDDYDGPADPEALLSALRRSALARHRQHVANVHRSYCGGAGLVSRRGTNRLRYSPTDELLKALILANVAVRMEFGEFLGVLYDRYGFVFGDREARQVLSPEEFDKRAFQANSERLESRLKTLGMLRRLSDACAYVENPLRKAAA